MQCRVAILPVLFNLVALAVIIDRIAVIVDNSIVKDSDIRRDIRVTDFLNGQLLNFSSAARKKAANRLIDQIFIRREIDLGNYPTATLQEADEQLGKLEAERFKTEASFQQALRSYGLTELDLRTQFQWNLTVLHFIDARFKPAVVVTNREIEKYYQEHEAALHRANPGKSLDDLRNQIRDTLTAEKVNQQFFAWLDQKRESTHIRYLEEGLA
jgi:hypothetical protein